MLAKQGGLKPVFDQPLARPGDRVDTGLQRRRDLAIAPARTTLRGVSFQQDAGLQQLLCRMFPAMDKGSELLSFLIAECHDVLLYRDLFSGHEPAPSLVTGASRQKIDAESMTDTTSQKCSLTRWSHKPFLHQSVGTLGSSAAKVITLKIRDRASN